MVRRLLEQVLISHGYRDRQQSGVASEESSGFNAISEETVWWISGEISRLFQVSMKGRGLQQSPAPRQALTFQQRREVGREGSRGGKGRKQRWGEEEATRTQ